MHIHMILLLKWNCIQSLLQQQQSFFILRIILVIIEHDLHAVITATDGFICAQTNVPVWSEEDPCPGVDKRHYSLNKEHLSGFTTKRCGHD